MIAAASLVTLAAGRLAARKPPKSETGQIAGNQNQPFQLRVERNTVLVRVVVRDARGRAVSGLGQKDFILSDNGKRQEISGFSTQGAGEPAEAPRASATAPSVLHPAPRAATPPAVIPNQFVALYYDDLWMPFSNIAFTRDTAERFIKSELKSNDRVGIFTSSGVGDIDFTADRGKLVQALMKLRPRTTGPPPGTQCPDLSDYEAWLIAEQEDEQILDLATEQVILCECNGDQRQCSDPRGKAKAAARMRWGAVEFEVRSSLDGLRHLVDRLSYVPGRRTILYISPGYVDMSELPELSAIVDSALRDGVVINGFDSRGLWAKATGGDASRGGHLLPVFYQTQLDEIEKNATLLDADALSSLADGTGGVFFRNSNDYDQGFRAAGGLPQSSYLLAFSPSDMKDNGAFHKLSVRLTGAAARRGLQVEARKGYYAPRKAERPGLREAEELHDAVFSRNEALDLPMSVETSIKKASQDTADLTVTVRLDGEGLRFAQKGNRNVDHFTSVTAIFDHNGRYLRGTEKQVDLRLTEAELEQVRTRGLRLDLDFTLAPGDYLVRNVVRDSSGALAAVNKTVRIEF